LLLCGHVGSAPMRRRMRMTSSMVFMTVDRMRNVDWLHPRKELWGQPKVQAVRSKRFEK
jgi:hypothetical protein